MSAKKMIKSCVQVAPPVHINNSVVVAPPSGYHVPLKFYYIIYLIKLCLLYSEIVQQQCYRTTYSQNRGQMSLCVLPCTSLQIDQPCSYLQDMHQYKPQAIIMFQLSMFYSFYYIYIILCSMLHRDANNWVKQQGVQSTNKARPL